MMTARKGEVNCQQRRDEKGRRGEQETERKRTGS